MADEMIRRGGYILERRGMLDHLGQVVPMVTPRTTIMASQSSLG